MRFRLCMLLRITLGAVMLAYGWAVDGGERAGKVEFWFAGNIFMVGRSEAGVGLEVAGAEAMNFFERRMASGE